MALSLHQPGGEEEDKVPCLRPDLLAEGGGRVLPLGGVHGVVDQVDLILGDAVGHQLPGPGSAVGHHGVLPAGEQAVAHPLGQGILG